MKTILLFLFALLSLEGFSQPKDSIRECYTIEYINDKRFSPDGDGIYSFKDTLSVQEKGGRIDRMAFHLEAEDHWVADCIARKVVPEEVMNVIINNLVEYYPYQYFLITCTFDSLGKIHSLEFFISGKFFEKLTVAQIKQFYSNLKQEKIPFTELYDFSENDLCEFKTDFGVISLIKGGSIPGFKKKEK